MFRSLLVPLDGSPTAAQILPYVPLVAAPDACVTLVGVAEPLLDFPSVDAHETESVALMERTRAYLWQDLETHAASLRARGFRVITTVRTGDITEEVVASAREADSDLIALTTHGTSDLSRWMLGSVAQHLLNAAMLPTLIIRARRDMVHEAPKVNGVLAPLDGWSLAETTLPLAEELAARLDVSLEIVRVVPNRASLLAPGDGSSDAARIHPLNGSLQQAYAAADQYVRSTVDRLRSTGCAATGNVRVGDPAATLATFLAERPNALVVIATHGEHGGDWWTFGSVAEKLVTTTPNPILIMRPLAEKTGRMRHDPAIAARYPD